MSHCLDYILRSVVSAEDLGEPWDPICEQAVLSSLEPVVGPDCHC